MCSSDLCFCGATAITACSEQNSLADTRGNGYVADKLRMMMMMTAIALVMPRAEYDCTLWCRLATLTSIMGH